MSEETKFAHLGKPGTAFSKGFQRRMELMERLIDFHDKKILDLGCGEGVWLAEFAGRTAKSNVFGSDIDEQSIEKARQNLDLAAENHDNLQACAAEDLQFSDDLFDIVFANEVLEHVVDDRQTVEEVLRVLRPGGKFVFFTPNRGWPFETHGMFWRGKYYWGNIFLLPWLPKAVYRTFAPHVRNYSNRDIKRMFQGLPMQITYHSHVFPGFDGMVRRFGLFGKIVQKTMHLLEKTPLHFFGISHFVIVEKKI